MLSSQTAIAASGDDQALLARCLEGDRQAWERLIERYQRLIYSVARLHFRDPAGADDVFQEVCLELYRRLGNLRDPQALPAWLITVTRRKALRAIENRFDWTEAGAGRPPVSDQAVATLERRFWLEAAMNRLPARCRALVELLYFDPGEPSYAEIAARLDMPAASIGPTRARCLEKLRRFCEESR